MNPTIQRECPVHGLTDFRVSKERPNGRCKKCSVVAVTKRRKTLKTKAVEYMGGRCAHCQNIFPDCVYEFHHTEPEHKDFGLSAKGITWGWAKIEAELNKCIMLCSNCHRIEHFAKGWEA